MMLKKELLITFSECRIEWKDRSRKQQDLKDSLCSVDNKRILIGANGNIKTSWKDVQDFEFLPDVRGLQEGIQFHDAKNNRTIKLSKPLQRGPWDPFKRFVEKKNKKTKRASGGMTSTRPHQLQKEAKKRGRLRMSYGRRNGPVKQSNDWKFSDDEEEVDDTAPQGDDSLRPFNNNDGSDHDKKEGDDEAEEVESGLESPEVSEKTPKRSENKHRLLQRKYIENSLSKMDDSDEELFADATTTTKSLFTAQRVVTPLERTQTQGDSKADPGEESETSPQKAKIHNFFLPKNATRATLATTDVGLKDDMKHLGGDKATKASATTPKAVTTKTTTRVTKQQPFFPSPPIPRPNLGTDEVDDSGVMTPELSPVDRQPPSTSKKPKLLLKRKHDGDNFDTRLALCSETDRSSPAGELRPDGFKRIRGPLTRPRNSIGAIVQGRLSEEINPFRGLKNIGNTCYLNASLQMLFALEDFISSLVGQGGSLVRSIVSTAREVYDSSKTEAATARDVKKEIDKVSNKFLGFEQRDAHEFIGDLIDLAHEEMLSKTKGRAEQPESSDANSAVESKPDDKMKVDSCHEKELDNYNPKPQKETVDEKKLPTDKWFRCEVETRLECKACKYSRTRMEMFRHLSLGVEGDPGHDGSISIQKSLESFFKPEEVDIKCEKCQAGKTALQTMKLVNRPKALLLHLKRFVVEHRKKENGEFETVCRKNKASVTLNVSVSVDKVTDMKDGAGEYSLCGFVRHQGVTAASGHYTAAAARSRHLSECDKESSGPLQEGLREWVSFDDVRTAITSLRCETSNLDNKKNAYLCLYALK